MTTARILWAEAVLAAVDPLALVIYLASVVAALLTGVFIGWEIGRRG